MKKSEANIEDLRNQTVSWGTHRPDDLIPKFLAVLKEYGKEAYDKYVSENPEVEDWKMLDDETKGWVVDELFDLLDGIAPEDCYFGAHPGDGADFGFWQVDESKRKDSKKSEGDDDKGCKGKDCKDDTTKKNEADAPFKVGDFVSYEAGKDGKDPYDAYVHCEVISINDDGTLDLCPFGTDAETDGIGDNANPAYCEKLDHFAGMVDANHYYMDGKYNAYKGGWEILITDKELNPKVYEFIGTIDDLYEVIDIDDYYGGENFVFDEDLKDEVENNTGWDVETTTFADMTGDVGESKKSEGLPPKKLGNRLYRSRADLINKMKTLDAVEITTPAQFNDIHSKQWLHTAGYAMDINGNLVGQTYFGDKDGKWYYATTKTFQGDYLPECKEEAKKSESKKNEDTLYMGCHGFFTKDGKTYVIEDESPEWDGEIVGKWSKSDWERLDTDKVIREWRKDHPTKSFGESKKSEVNGDTMVIYKELGTYYTTNKKNYDARIQDANRIQKWDGFDTPQEIIDYCKKYSRGFDPDDVLIVESKKPEKGNKDIYTLDLTRIDAEGDEEGLDDMQAAQNFYDEDEAIQAAKDLADSYKDDDDVVQVTVMAGEQEKPNGDIVGEPFDIFTASSSDSATTAKYREKANYTVTDGLDYYAKGGKSESHKTKEKLSSGDYTKYWNIDHYAAKAAGWTWNDEQECYEDKDGNEVDWDSYDAVMIDPIEFGGHTYKQVNVWGDGTVEFQDETGESLNWADFDAELVSKVYAAIGGVVNESKKNEAKYDGPVTLYGSTRYDDAEEAQKFLDSISGGEVNVSKERNGDTLYVSIEGADDAIDTFLAVYKDNYDTLEQDCDADVNGWTDPVDLKYYTVQGRKELTGESESKQSEAMQNEGWTGGFGSRQEILDLMDGGIFTDDWKLEKRFGNWGCYVNQKTGRPIVLQMLIEPDNDHGWAYKPVTSDMGPYDINIQAAKWLKPRLEKWVEENPDKSKDVPGYEWEWIEKCLGKAAATKSKKDIAASLVKGDKIKLIDTVANGAVVTFIEMMAPGKMRILHNGREMSCKTSYIDRKVDAPAESKKGENLESSIDIRNRKNVELSEMDYLTLSRDINSSGYYKSSGGTYIVYVGGNRLGEFPDIAAAAEAGFVLKESKKSEVRSGWDIDSKYRYIDEFENLIGMDISDARKEMGEWWTLATQDVRDSRRVYDFKRSGLGAVTLTADKNNKVVKVSGRILRVPFEFSQKKQGESNKSERAIPVSGAIKQKINDGITQCLSTIKEAGAVANPITVANNGERPAISTRDTFAYAPSYVYRVSGMERNFVGVMFHVEKDGQYGQLFIGWDKKNNRPFVWAGGATFDSYDSFCNDFKRDFSECFNTTESKKSESKKNEDTLYMGCHGFFTKDGKTYVIEDESPEWDGEIVGKWSKSDWERLDTDKVIREWRKDHPTKSFGESKKSESYPDWIAFYFCVDNLGDEYAVYPQGVHDRNGVKVVDLQSQYSPIGYHEAYKKDYILDVMKPIPLDEVENSAIYKKLDDGEDREIIAIDKKDAERIMNASNPLSELFKVVHEYDIYKGEGIVNVKKSESLTLKQKELKNMARYGEATDITTISDAEAKELKKKGIETVGISRGAYGMNGALLRDNEGKKYVITARSSNLFYFV